MNQLSVALGVLFLAGCCSCGHGGDGKAAAIKAGDGEECTGQVRQGTDKLEEHTGLLFTAKVLPKGHFHTFKIVSQPNPPVAYFNFTSPSDSLIGCIDKTERSYNPFDSRIFVFAGDGCFHPPHYRPIRGCPTKYGWRFEIDSSGSGKYDMVVQFIEGN